MIHCGVIAKAQAGKLVCPSCKTVLVAEFRTPIMPPATAQEQAERKQAVENILRFMFAPR